VEDHRNMQISVSGGVSSSIAQKIHEEMICIIPDSKNLHVMFDKEGRVQ
jgi:hypothetical protein